MANKQSAINSTENSIHHFRNAAPLNQSFHLPENLGFY